MLLFMVKLIVGTAGVFFWLFSIFVRCDIDN